MTDKPIYLDGVDVSGCKGFYIHDRSTTNIDYWMYGQCKSSKEYGCYCRNNPNCYFKQLQRKEQECEKLKKQLMQKSEVDMFFNTPIEGWSNDPCGICPHKAENEELKKEIINKNEKIKELRFSVSDLTNRLCYLNAEKSFRIVDLEQALDEIAAHYQKVIKNITTYDDSYDASISIEALHNISDIINKAKDGE